MVSPPHLCVERKGRSIAWKELQNTLKEPDDTAHSVNYNLAVAQEGRRRTRFPSSIGDSCAARPLLQNIEVRCQ